MWRATAVMVVVAGLCVGTPARAVFHDAVIDEVLSGYNGDPAVQYVEIRMLSAGQNQVGGSRLRVFSCDGNSEAQLLNVSGGVSNGMSGARWLMGTPAFAGTACMTPDFIFTPTGTGVFPTCGMVCWGKPASGQESNPNQYVDCVAWGNYTGPLAGGAGPILGDTPGNGSQSLTRDAGVGFDNDFSLAAPSPTNNAGEIGVFGGTCPSTTSTSTSTSSTVTLPPGATTSTTTSGGGSTTSTTTGPAILGGGSAKTDCFAEWRVAGASATAPVVRCSDNDTTCDQSPEPGCVVRTQLCFNDAAAAIYGGRCTASPVTAFALSGTPDAQNAAAVGAALQQLPGVQPALVGVSFAPPLAALTCSGPIDLEVPLKVKGTKIKKGVRALKSVTTADKRDKDKLKILCIP